MSKKILYFKLSTGGRTREAICTKIEQIDAIIDSLFVTALTSVGNGNMMEYELDTGQSKQRVIYTTPGQVTAALAEYEKMRTYYSNKLTPRIVTLRNYKNFR